jgi:hypothetical protein
VDYKYKMEIDKARLELLYEHVIAQKEYPSNVCPTEQKLVDFIMGSLSTIEYKRLKKHLADCSDCLKLADKLQKNSQWFADNKTHMFAGLLDKAAKVGVEPWASCLSLDVLHGYIMNNVPDTRRGALLRKRIETHLQGCKSCRESTGKLKVGLERSIIVTMADLEQKADEATRAIVRGMLLAIRSVAAARGYGNIVSAMPGFRSQFASSVSALLLDQDGRIVLDDNGHPRKVKFDLIRAEVGRDGHVLIDLSTTDRNFWESKDHTFKVSAALQQENRKLILPSEKICSDGRVTVAGNLVSGIEIRVLPISAMIFTVVPVEENTSF